MAVKAREDRQKVMIKARMRSGVAWHDVCILNLSLHGLGIQSAVPPPRGSYVEIRRGQQTIIARVAWNKGHRAGLRSQDPIFIQALIHGNNDAAPPRKDAIGRVIERRHGLRPARAHDNSRLKGRAIEFACFAVVGGAFALVAISTVAEALGRPMSAVHAALGPLPSPDPAPSEGVTSR